MVLIILFLIDFIIAMVRVWVTFIYNNIYIYIYYKILCDVVFATVASLCIFLNEQTTPLVENRSQSFDYKVQNIVSLIC
jgi:hypothetical protein